MTSAMPSNSPVASQRRALKRKGSAQSKRARAAFEAGDDPVMA